MCIGTVVANDEQTVKEKLGEDKIKTGNKSVLEGVPKSLPALVKAIRTRQSEGRWFWLGEERASVAKSEEEMGESKRIQCGIKQSHQQKKKKRWPSLVICCSVW